MRKYKCTKQDTFGKRCSKKKILEVHKKWQRKLLFNREGKNR